ncbi:MAG: hypothetical protein ACP6IP_08555 [Candidatus Njordarchaeia archaeon]
MGKENDRDEVLEEVIRHAGAAILAYRYRSKGTPVARIKKIFSKYGIPYSYGLGILERKLREVGIILKNIQIRHGSKFINVLIPVIDPSLDLPDISMFDKATTAILGLIYLKSENGIVGMDDLIKNLSLIVHDEEEARDMVYKAISRLRREKLVEVIGDKKVIKLTELGLALAPPRDLLDKIALDILIIGKKDGGENV